eukprot:gene45622-60977_t
MGQRDLFLACFGMAEISGGTLRVDGADAVVLSPSQAIQAGICLVPEDRKTEGLFLELNGRHNASMPVIQRFIGGGLIDHASETDAVGAVFDRLDIDRRALWTHVVDRRGGRMTGRLNTWRAHPLFWPLVTLALILGSIALVFFVSVFVKRGWLG